MGMQYSCERWSKWVGNETKWQEEGEMDKKKNGGNGERLKVAYG